MNEMCPATPQTFFFSYIYRITCLPHQSFALVSSKISTNFCLSSRILRKIHIFFLILKNFTYYMPFERKFSADKMLLNEFCLKSVRFLVIASDLQLSLIKKLYFLKKKLKLQKDFFDKIRGCSWHMFDYHIKLLQGYLQQILRKK